MKCLLGYHKVGRAKPRQDIDRLGILPIVACIPSIFSLRPSQDSGTNFFGTLGWAEHVDSASSSIDTLTLSPTIMIFSRNLGNLDHDLASH